MEPDPTPADALTAQRRRAAAAERAAASFVPVDVAALDPPPFCERCGRPITGDDLIDYQEGADGALAIVHEGCAGPVPPAR